MVKGGVTECDNAAMIETTPPTILHLGGDKPWQNTLAGGLCCCNPDNAWPYINTGRSVRSRLLRRRSGRKDANHKRKKYEVSAHRTGALFMKRHDIFFSLVVGVLVTSSMEEGLLWCIYLTCINTDKKKCQGMGKNVREVGTSIFPALIISFLAVLLVTHPITHCLSFFFLQPVCDPF